MATAATFPVIYKEQSKCLKNIIQRMLLPKVKNIIMQTNRSSLTNRFNNFDDLPGIQKTDEVSFDICFQKIGDTKFQKIQCLIFWQYSLEFSSGKWSETKKAKLDSL